MYTGYSNKYFGLDPNLGSSGNLPPPFMARSGFPIPNYNFTLPRIMAGATTPMPAIQPDSANTSMMRLLNFMIVSKQAEKAQESGDSVDTSGLQEFSQLLGSLPMGNNNGMASLFGMMTLMAQLDSLDSDNTSHNSRHNAKINSKNIKVKDLSPEFLDKVKKIADELNCDSKDLLAVMYAESGLDSTAVNKTPIKTKDGRTLPPTYATGLIQFTKKSAADLNTTRAELKEMTPEKQLDYVEKYLKKVKQDLGLGDKSLSSADVYALVFLPGRIKRNILTSSGENYYEANTGLDKDHNGNISKSDLEKIMDEKKRIIFE